MSNGYVDQWGVRHWVATGANEEGAEVTNEGQTKSEQDVPTCMRCGLEEPVACVWREEYGCLLADRDLRHELEVLRQRVAEVEGEPLFRKWRESQQRLTGAESALALAREKAALADEVAEWMHRFGVAREHELNWLARYDQGRIGRGARVTETKRWGVRLRGLIEAVREVSADYEGWIESIEKVCDAIDALEAKAALMDEARELIWGFVGVEWTSLRDRYDALKGGDLVGRSRLT